jgi:hypothetical protein
MIIKLLTTTSKRPLKMCPWNNLKLFKDSHHPSYIKKMKIYDPGTILNGLRILATPATSRK